MLKELGFHRGVNLGGWLSQCDYSDERMNTFIREEDFAVIASWGLDHVRIPIDYNVLETEDGGYRPEGFARLEKAIGWARANGLRVIIDLHKTAGFSFDEATSEKGFFESEALQERFMRLWEELARHFGGDPERVAFELLNEVTSEQVIGVWNRIIAACIARIRVIAPETLILVGSYHNNSAPAVPALDPPYDDRVIYNFHCYEPLAFTHQGATWTAKIDPAKRVPFGEAGVTEAYFEELFATAIAKAEKHGAELYCGEYGVIDKAEPEDALRWYETINRVFERHGIARAAWSYRQMDFGLADSRMDGVRDRLIKVL